ncbi:DNA adenine methylase [uncultured Methanospirillum sp.]|uniref:DNA adenine methylase n=1 Tax=uncultured Methanospirillum sp. TaxID=262503 RepID=UPI0029C8BC2D|nr:DNA adenine methylase [uncultured Methanospirillum sp.]
MSRNINQEKGPAKPFFKWAGGKNQLLQEFDSRFPYELRTGILDRYVEPFIGGGAVLFYLVQHFPIKESFICDVNEELILTYSVVKKDVKALISLLSHYQERYDILDENERSFMYYEVRDELNEKRRDIDFSIYETKWIERAAQLLFLNKTCFNGLFRLNSKGGFNVPFGRYKNPKIANESNLLKVSKLLSQTTILLGDFSICQEYVDDRTFVYLDPPYRPLNQTSSFTSYSKEGFSELDQIRLSKFFAVIDKIGAKAMLSNSDPKNENPTDHFFDDLYKPYLINRVMAKRSINSVGGKRGEISEIIVMNYQPPDIHGT